VETVAHIQSAGCKAQKKSEIGAHNRCWKYLVGAITTHGEAKRDLEFIGGDKDRQLKKLWAETRIGSILPWDDIEDEAERLLESDGVTEHTSENTHADQDLGDGQGVDLMKLILPMKSYLGGEDQIRSQLIGTTRFYTF
jgi:hypothetical protein